MDYQIGEILFQNFSIQMKSRILSILTNYEDRRVDLSRKYIYVPLHNQPEMSTSALGGKYRDQALLIEDLAKRFA